ncbi:lipopolysaccharide heptosyltransferase II [Zavarzinia sp. CC-PAN008]|uniref:lipopolysaccharide heptosyltransferase II n=1 Tax=Zavarzinia sp. CC-PAN008 TaxID=3243332 RepID=UPI003F7468BC
MSARVLIVAPAWLGDMMMCQGLVAGLKQAGRARSVHLLCPPATAPLARLLPQVDGVEVLEAGHGDLALRRRLALGRALRGRFDWAIVLPRSFKAALVPWAARIARRTGYAAEGRAMLLTERPRPSASRRTFDRFLHLGGVPDAPWPRLSVAPAATAQTLDALAIAPPPRPPAILCPGGDYGPAKRWPVAHFAELGRLLAARGEPVWVLGGASEAEAGQAIHRACGAVDLTGRTTIAQAAALLAMAGRVFTNDSGLMHVAAALAVPVVALYGPSSPDLTPPLSILAEVRTLALPCQPCFKRHCPLAHHRCLRDLEPSAVLEDAAA